MNEWIMEKRTEKEIANERTTERTNERTNERMKEWTNEWMNEWTHERMNEGKKEGRNEGMNEWMRRHVDKPSCDTIAKVVGIPRSVPFPVSISMEITLYNGGLPWSVARIVTLWTQSAANVLATLEVPLYSSILKVPFDSLVQWNASLCSDEMEPAIPRTM